MATFTHGSHRNPSIRGCVCLPTSSSALPLAPALSFEPSANALALYGKSRWSPTDDPKSTSNRQTAGRSLAQPTAWPSSGFRERARLPPATGATATAEPRRCAVRKETNAPPNRAGSAGSCGSNRPRSIVPNGRAASGAASRNSSPACTNRPSKAAAEAAYIDSRRGTNTFRVEIADGMRHPVPQPARTRCTPDQRQK